MREASAAYVSGVTKANSGAVDPEWCLEREIRASFSRCTRLLDDIMYLTHPLRLVAQGPKATNHSFVSTGGGVATKLGPEFRTVTSGVRSPCLFVHVYLASHFLGCVSSGRYSSPSQPAPHRRGGGGTAAILTPVPAVGHICCL